MNLSKLVCIAAKVEWMYVNLNHSVAALTFVSTCLPWMFLTYRFDGFFQPEDLFLQQMEGSGFTTVTGKCCCTCAMDAVHPVFQLDLNNSLNIRQSICWTILEQTLYRAMVWYHLYIHTLTHTPGLHRGRNL